MDLLKLSAAALSALALSACVVAPYPRYAAYGDDVAITAVAPPPIYAEVRPVVPYGGAIWIDGYWGWSGGRHVWVGGRWDHPRPGYAYAPHRWVQGGGQWHLRGGGWVRQ